MLSTQNKNQMIYSSLLDIRFTTYIRGVAIIMVILCHAHQQFTELSAYIKNPLSFCQMGAQVFLILSSFGLCISYTKRKPKYLAFLKHRLLKIGVAYWIAIALYLFVGLLSILMVGENVIGTSTDPIAIICNVLMVHGLVPIMSVCNYVVRGGWFVGTIVIFYIFFPLLYKVYFSTRLKFWVKYRIILFPVIIQFFSFLIVYGLGMIYSMGIVHENLICYNNSVVYFNIINQLPCISLGFSLFDICVNVRKRIRIPWLYSLLFFTLSIFLFFFYDYHTLLVRCAFIFVPFIFGCGFVFLLLSIEGFVKNKSFLTEEKPKSVIYKFGLLSLGIYLIHFFFVYDFEKLVLTKIFSPNNLVVYILIFIICLVFVFPLSYYSGLVFNKAVQRISKIIMRQRDDK